MAECYNLACPYCEDYKCKRTATCDMRLDGEYVKVVRCKDCKWAEFYIGLDGKTRYCFCAEHERGGNTENDYCSYAERKDEVEE